MQKEKTGKIIRDYALTVLFAVLIALFIRFFLLEAYRIPTGSMRPTLQPGDVIFVSKLPFGIHAPWNDVPLRPGRLPARGEVVLYTHPSEPDHDYIKRVIGLPGDSVQIKGGALLLNGKAVVMERDAGSPCGRERLPEGQNYPVCWEPPAVADFGPEKIPEGSAFVLGDLRTQPIPKGWGVIPLSSIRGKALWIWLSIAPPTFETASSWTPQFRLERMFRRIE